MEKNNIPSALWYKGFSAHFCTFEYITKQSIVGEIKQNFRLGTDTALRNGLKILFITKPADYFIIQMAEKA